MDKERREVMVFCLSACIIGAVAVGVLFPASAYRRAAVPVSRETVGSIDLKGVLSLGDDDKVLIDLRRKEQFDHSHIPGSLNFPEPWRLPEILEKLPRKQIILVNLARNRESSVRFSQLLQSQQITGVFIYSGGWEEWKACRLPTEGSGE